MVFAVNYCVSFQQNAMRKQIHIIQHLIPATMYKIRVLSFLNDTVSPTTNTLTVFTESLGMLQISCTTF